MKTPEPTGTAPLEERYRALLGLGRTFLGSSTSRDLYQTIYVETAKVIELSGFMLSLYDDQSEVATVVFSAKEGKESKSGLTYAGSDSEVLRTGEPTAIENQTDMGALLFPGDGAPGAGARSTLSVPLLWRNHVTGALAVFSSHPDAYVAADSEVLGRVADLAAVALENMRHVEELQRRSFEAEKLEEIGRVLVSSLDFEEVLERVSYATMELLHLDGAGVWTHEDGCGTVRTSVGEIPFPVGTTWTLSDAVAEAVLVNGEPFRIEDVGSHDNREDLLGICFQTGSAVSTPIKVGDRVVGALAARSKQVRRFTDTDVRMLGRLAAQASAALDNAELHASIQALSLTDALTGLSNRRHLQLHLEREVAAARRGRKLALVLFDLDSFKHYNDTLGHVVGDQILKAFGGILTQENRAMNLVARYGGDEFVSVLSEGDAQGAQGYLARIHKGVKGDPLLASHGVTVSSGVAEFEAAEMVGVEELIQAADRNMYKNKAAKR
ncbi:MAG: diguanylate cyclase [Gemmatimonadetes bacterium]|nr:diguanylate cyclase [Gemmatimonadota bacterium]